MKTYSEDGQCFVDMEYAFTMDVVGIFYKELVPLLSMNKEFVIHCIDLKELDSAGLQILISLKEEVEKDGKIFELTAGKILRDFISFFGMDDYFKGVIV